MRRRGASNVKISFTAGQLTHFGGVYLLHQFLQRLQLRTFLSRRLQLPERNNHFSVTERLLALVYPMILGLTSSVELSSLLGTNGVFQYLTGLSKFPHPDTLRKFLKSKSESLLPRLQSAHHDLRQHFLILPRPRTSYWLDFDSTVKTLYGNQEGVTKGYNPGNKGKKSYHPLICTEAHLRDCLAGELRYGNSDSATGVLVMLETAFDLIPSIAREVRVRADAGFYDKKFVAKLSQRNIKFAIAADKTSPVKNKVPGLRYRKANQVLSTSEFKYQPDKWPEKYRFVVLREKLTEDRKEKLKLFTLDAYAYHVLVTNLELTPYGVFKFYAGRSGMAERIIRTLKDDYPFGKAPTQSFMANSFYAELSLLAYDLVVWFKRLCLPEDWQTLTVETLRRRLLLIPGNFTRTDNRPELKLPSNTPYRDTCESALKKIKKLKPLV